MSETQLYAGEYQWAVVAISSVAGYLLGSVSFARLVNYWVSKTTKVTPFSESVPHSDETFESDLVSATVVTKNLGARYGCITSVADMIKVAIPTLAFKLMFPDNLYFLLAAFFGVLGHNFPVWYRFRGGRGESPIIGSLLVINWYGLIITNIAGTILGFITGSVLVIRWGGMVLMILWLWILFRDINYVIFMILVNSLFWISMRKDLSRFIELKRKRGLSFTEEEVSEFILMGKGLGRTLDRYSGFAILKRLLKKKE
jgi:acyl phosphate:glycerol-3-phosphate acyltransferase